ncbi:MAG: NADH-quinone oxidoreductase subunit I [Sedimentibacter sp.]
MLEALKSVKFKFKEENDNTDMFWEYWDVNIECDGCGKCATICPGKAWKIENNDLSIKLYHNFGKCYKCGLCEKVCPKKALTKGKIRNFTLPEFNLKREITLNTCYICNKKFIPKSKEDKECDICKKKELLRRKISTSI